MKVETELLSDGAARLTVPEALLKSSAGGLAAFDASLRPLRAALACVRQMGDAAAQKGAARLIRRLDEFEPSITLIGQIKSGKTTLVNSMIGWPNLLPADVNPWTSVVTSLHLSTAALEPKTSAKFQFFDHREWDRLVSGGGRVGELANRAGADAEFSTIKRQVEMMREKSKARLGRKFEMLLGAEHKYGYFDQELIERYVCLGDDFENDKSASNSRGRFADITKSASLAMQQRALPINLCVRDTPGVNDTFMMREQITIKSIRDSRICVVVLSAHQALSSTDLALIRLISNVKSREVIIYVNRIDELSDPATQVTQIRSSILATLEKHKGPAAAQIIFGSALWAQAAALDSFATLSDASKKALLNWAENTNVAAIETTDPANPHTLMWDLSGLPELYAAISDRIVEGEGREIIQQVAVSARNLINGILISDNLSAKSKVGTATVRLPTAQIAQTLERIQSDRMTGLGQEMNALNAAFCEQVERSHNSFLNRATEALAKHLEMYGEQSVWTYDPTGLRLLLGASYKKFGAKSQLAFSKAAALTVQDLSQVYHRALELPVELFDPHIPPAPRIPPPVSLGQTIALDLQGSWWKGWWSRRRSYQAHAESFYDLIRSETESLCSDLTGDQADAIERATFDLLQRFLTEQTTILASITADKSVSADKIDTLLCIQELEERHRALTDASRSLERHCK